jgi:hypothetical protein
METGFKIILKKTKTRVKPPKHLSRAMKKWWTAVNESYVLEDHHRLLLTKAAEAHDRGDLIFLVKGFHYFTDFLTGPDDVETATEIWSELRENILTEHIRREPFSRPWAFDSTHALMKTDGVCSPEPLLIHVTKP